MANDRLVLAKSRSLTINACGRTISVAEASVPRIPDLEKVLQDELGLQEQLFEVYDLTGARLATDADLREAIADGRTPLAATLSDASIHFIENRREELAQLQWKVMRDQNNQSNVKVLNLTRQVSNVETALEISKKEQQSNNELIRQQMLGAIEVAKELFRSESRQLQEKMAAIGQLMTTERGIREVAVEQVNKALQGARDSIDSESVARNQVSSRTMSQMEEMRRRTEQEKLKREQLETLHAQDIQRLGERIDDVVSSIKSSMHEYSRGFESASLEATQAIESHAREIRKVRSSGDQAVADATTRLSLLEARCEAFESQLVEQQQRHSEAMDRVCGRSEKVTTSLEQLRFDSGQQEQTAQSVLARIQALEEQSKHSEVECREVLERDRRHREEELRLFKEAIKADQARLRSTLDDKVCERLERESCAREASCGEILQKVKDAMTTQANGSSASKLESLESLQKQEQAATSLRSATEIVPASGSTPNGTPVCTGSFAAVSSSKQGSWCASLADLATVSSPAMSFGNKCSEAGIGSFTVSAPRRESSAETVTYATPVTSASSWVQAPSSGGGTSPSATAAVRTSSVPGSLPPSTPPAGVALMQRSPSVLRRLGQPSRDVSPLPQPGNQAQTVVPPPVVFPSRFTTPSRSRSPGDLVMPGNTVAAPSAQPAMAFAPRPTTPAVAGAAPAATMLYQQPVQVQSSSSCGLPGTMVNQMVGGGKHGK